MVTLRHNGGACQLLLPKEGHYYHLDKEVQSAEEIHEDACAHGLGHKL